MVKMFFEVMNNASQRYLNSTEKKVLTAYIDSFPQRLSASQELEEKEQEIIQYCITETKKRHPELHTKYDNVWSKALRDLQLVVRSMSHAMILDDPQYLMDKTLIWFKSVMIGLQFTPQLTTNTYTSLKHGAQRSLSSDTFDILEPYFDMAIDVLGSIPEPTLN